MMFTLIHRLESCLVPTWWFICWRSPVSPTNNPSSGATTLSTTSCPMKWKTSKYSEPSQYTGKIFYAVSSQEYVSERLFTLFQPGEVLLVERHHGLLVRVAGQDYCSIHRRSRGHAVRKWSFWRSWLHRGFPVSYRLDASGITFYYSGGEVQRLQGKSTKEINIL